MSRKPFKRLFCKYKIVNRFYWYVYDFSVDYDAIAVDDILDINKYLMKRYNTK